MLNSVRGCACSGEAGGFRQLCELSVIAQVNNGFSGLVRSQVALLILGLLAVLVVGGVIMPAVWSNKKTRRTAALDVLDRLLRWRR